MSHSQIMRQERTSGRTDKETNERTNKQTNNDIVTGVYAETDLADFERQKAITRIFFVTQITP